MEQLQLIKTSKMFYTAAKVLLVMLAISVLAAILFFYYFIYSKDPFISYYPESTQFYLSLNIEPGTEWEKLLPRFFVSQLDHDAAVEAINMMEGSTKSRTLSFGSIPINGNNEWMIILEQPQGFSNLLIDRVNKKNWHLYKTSDGLLNSSQMIIVSNPIVYDELKKILDKQTKSLGDNLSVQLAINSQVTKLGTIYLKPEFINQYLNKNLSDYNQYLNFDGETVLGLDNIFPNITFSSDGFQKESLVSIPEPQLIDYYAKYTRTADRISEKSLTMIMSELSNISPVSSQTNPLSYIRTNGPLSVNFVKFKDDSWYSEIEMVKNYSLDQLAQFFSQYLGFTYIKTSQIKLPDKSEINILEFNDEIIPSFENTRLVYDLKEHGVRYSLGSTGNTISLGFNRENHGSFSTISGCHTSSKSDLMAIDTNLFKQGSFIERFFDLVVFSTYPQGYPQIMVCMVKF